MRPTLLLLLVGLAGCYGLVPIDPAHPPPPGTIVEAELTPIRARVLRGGRTELEESPGERFRGEIVTMTADSLILSTWNTDLGTPRESVRIPREELVSLQVVTFSARQTGMVAVGIAAMGLILYARINTVTGAPPSGGDPPADGGFRISLSRLLSWQ